MLITDNVVYLTANSGYNKNVFINISFTCALSYIPMKEQLSNFFAFDIGSSKIAAVNASITREGKVKINSQVLRRSNGFKSSSITNMELAEGSLIDAIYALERKTNKSIKEIAVSLSGSGVKSYYVRSKIKLKVLPITDRDLRKLIRLALVQFRVENQEIVHYFPIEFILDSKKNVDNPIGMYAREVSCQLHIISADSFMIMNLTSCLAKCYVEVTDIFLSIYSSGISCLTQDEKQLGSIIIDIGSNTSSFGIFLNNQLIYTGYVPIGGEDITHDIAKTFSISIQDADRVKILYGSSSAKIMSSSNIIRLDKMRSNNNYNSELTITDIDLAKIIESKVRKIFVNIKNDCDRISINHLLAKKIIVTGGGSSLPGLSNLATDIFQKQVRIAKQEILLNFNQDHNPYVYSTVIGMVQAKYLKYKKNFFASSPMHSSIGWPKRAFSWLQKNVCRRL